MKVHQPRWLVAAVVSNLAGLGCFMASMFQAADVASRLIILGLGFAAAGLYMFVVSCKRTKD